MSKTIKTLLAGAAGALALAGAAAAQTYAITNARVLMTGEGGTPGAIDEATVLVRDGKIEAVGRDVRVPRTAEVIDGQGGVVTPGIFAALSGLGLEEIGLNGEANDRAAYGSPLSASIDAADGFYADSSIIPINRAGGVTRAYVAPDPGDDLFGGCGMLVRLAPEAGDTVGAGAITDPCLAQTVSLGYAGAQRVGDSRPAAMSRLRRAFEDARDYAADPQLYRRTYEEGRLPTRDAEALVPVLTGRQKLLVRVQGASDIRRVLDLSDQYGLDLVLYGAAEAWRVADELAARRVPVILDPLQNLPDQFETFGATLEAARILDEAGVTVAFYDGDIGYTHNLRLLPQLAGNAVANGMSYAGALSAITEAPAEIWGRPDLGRVAPGMTADLVLWDGDPLEVTSRPQAVLIEGERVSLENRQSALTRRYRDLARGDRPIAYRE
jgi:imidazolonepropionase-like amidohydrolase